MYHECKSPWLTVTLQFHKYCAKLKSTTTTNAKSRHSSMSFFFSFHYGLLSFGCQGNRLNLFVLSFFVKYGGVPHGRPSVPTQCFIISWIRKQNTGNPGKYIKEGKYSVTYTATKKHNCLGSNSKMALCRTVSLTRLSIIIFRYTVIITVQLNRVATELKTSHIIYLEVDWAILNNNYQPLLSNIGKKNWKTFTLSL